MRDWRLAPDDIFLLKWCHRCKTPNINRKPETDCFSATPGRVTISHLLRSCSANTQWVNGYAFPSWKRRWGGGAETPFFSSRLKWFHCTLDVTLCLCHFLKPWVQSFFYSNFAGSVSDENYSVFIIREKEVLAGILFRTNVRQFLVDRGIHSFLNFHFQPSG